MGINSEKGLGHRDFGNSANRISIDCLPALKVFPASVKIHLESANVPGVEISNAAGA